MNKLHHRFFTTAIVHLTALFLVLTSCSQFGTKSANDAGTMPADSKALDQDKINSIVREQKKKEAMSDLPVRGIDASKTLHKIVFGSCLDQTLPSPILKNIINENADFMILMGDNVYAAQSAKKPIADQYLKLNQITDWQTLRQTVPMMATWDDHDFGADDGTKSNPEKNTARSEFLKYFHYVKNSFANKNQMALYHSKIIGGKNQQVQILMMDLRWDQDDIEKQEFENSKKPLKVPTTNKNLKLISEQQWQWLEQELKKPAQIRFLVSSIQFLAEDHIYERWSLFPHEKARMIQLLKRSKVKNLFILSGDRHFAAFAKEDVSGYGPLYDFTSSSFNSAKNAVSEDSRYLFPIYNQENYGLIEINWQKRELSFAIKNLSSESPIKTSVKF